MKKILSIGLLTAVGALMSLTSCGGGSEKGSANSSASASDPVDSASSSAEHVVKERKLTGSYLTGAKLSYMNMRPTYNYYTTTFSFEGLETYSDNSYVFTLASMSYSGLNLPGEGNDASGSERENFVKKFYGTYSSKTNELDEGMLDITLEVPTRVTNAYNCQYFADTATWTDATAAAVSKDSYGNESETKYTAETYLASQAFNKTTVSVTTATASFDYFTLREDGSADPKVTVSTETYGLTGAYLSPSDLAYSNFRPTYNYYTTRYTEDYIETYSDGTYRADIICSMFSGLNLPEEGNDATGSDRANYIQSFYGEYTSKANELDETMIDLTIKSPTSVKLAYDAAYFVDSDNWTEAMSNATATTDRATGEKTINYNNGKEYLNAVKYEDKEISITTSTASFDFVKLSAELN